MDHPQHRCIGEQEGEKDTLLPPKDAYSSGRDRGHKHANKAISAHETEEKIEEESMKAKGGVFGAMLFTFFFQLKYS